MRKTDADDVAHEHSSGNIFTDLGFDPRAAAELTTKSALVSTISAAIKESGLTLQAAARLCGTDQPALAEVLRGRMEIVTADTLTAWLAALGRSE